MTDDEPYKPNKYTRHISAEGWRAFTRGDSTAVPIVDPGYINEPGDEPRMRNQPPDEWPSFDDYAQRREDRVDTALIITTMVLIGFALYGLARWLHP